MGDSQAAPRQDRERRLVVLVITLGILAVGLGIAIVSVAVATSPSPRRQLVDHAYTNIGHPFAEWLPSAVREDRDEAHPTFPRAWLPTRGDECHEYRALTICEGPRMVPRPFGEAARRAAELGLGGRQTAETLLHHRPPVDWILEVRGQHSDMFHWPIEDGHGENVWRGLSPGSDDESEPPHNGVDIGAAAGTRIVAVANGLTAYSDNELSGYGNMMLIIHVDGTVSLYAHCRANYLFPGQLVRAGQIIGEVGETGITHGAHLHFEHRENGEPRNPLPRFRRWLDDQEAQHESL